MLQACYCFLSKHFKEKGIFFKGNIFPGKFSEKVSRSINVNFSEAGPPGNNSESIQFLEILRQNVGTLARTLAGHAGY